MALDFAKNSLVNGRLGGIWRWFKFFGANIGFYCAQDSKYGPTFNPQRETLDDKAGHWLEKRYEI